MNRNNVSVESTIAKPNERFLEKVKKYKKEIIIGSTVVGAVVGAIIFKNRSESKAMDPVAPTDSNQRLQITSKSNMPRGPLDCDPFVVRSHIRNLPERCHASQKQIELAKSLGINLELNQTIVRPYLKCAS